MIGVQFDGPVEHRECVRGPMESFGEQVGFELQPRYGHRVELDRFLHVLERGSRFLFHAVLGPGNPAQFIRGSNRKTRCAVRFLTLEVAADVAKIGAEKVSRAGA